MVKGKAGPRPGPVKKKAKPDKAPKKKSAAQEEVKASAAGSTKIDRDRQKLAIVHRDAYAKAKAAQDKAARAMQALGKVIKADGFTVKQIKVMVDLTTPEGEEALKLSLTQTLEAARWSNSPIGAQLDMFMEPDRRPAVDMAYEEGVADAMEGKSPKPGYDPSVPQHASYMKGWNEEQERMIKKGIKPTEPTEEKPRAEVLAAAREANAAEPKTLN